MRVWEFGLFTRGFWGLHLLIHTVNEGAGLGGLFYIELPVISFNLKILILDIILTIGRVEKEIAASAHRKAQSEGKK